MLLREDLLTIRTGAVQQQDTSMQPSQTIRWGLVLVSHLGSSSLQSDCLVVPDQSWGGTQVPSESEPNLADLINQVTVNREYTPTIPENDLCQFTHTRSVVARGVEFAEESARPWDLRALASYTFTHTRHETLAEQWENSPRQPGKLHLSASLGREKNIAGLDRQDTSEHRCEAGRGTNAYATFSFSLFSRRLVRGLEFSACIYNLFDQRSSHPVLADFTILGQVSGGSIVLAAGEQDGRSSRVKLRCRF